MNKAVKSSGKKQESQDEQSSLFEQARLFYKQMVEPPTILNSSTSKKIQKQQTNSNTDATWDQVEEEWSVSDQNLTVKQDLYQNSFDSQSVISYTSSSGRNSGRRLRSQRSSARGKTPTSVSQSEKGFEEIVFQHMGLEGIQTMDDFANMLLAKHNQAKSAQKNYVNIQQTPQTEIKQSIFSKTRSSLTQEKQEEQVSVQQFCASPLKSRKVDSPQSVSKLQMCAIQEPCEQLPIYICDQNDCEFSPVKYQQIPVTFIAEETIQNSPQQFNEEEKEGFNLMQVQSSNKKNIRNTPQNCGNLTSIKEHNESQENALTSNLSRNLEMTTSLICVSDHLLKVFDGVETQEADSSSHLEQHQQDTQKDVYSKEVQCEEESSNFGGLQSPIKLNHNPESTDQVGDHESWSNTQRRDSSPNCQQHDHSLFVHLQGQLDEALNKIELLEQQLQASNLAKADLLAQKQNQEDQLNSCVNAVKTEYEVQIEKLRESHKNEMSKLNQESQNSISLQEHERRVIYIKNACLMTSQDKARQLESIVMQLRQDNQNMFTDLKQLAQSEKSLKLELAEAQHFKAETDSHIKKLTETIKQQQLQSTEQLKNFHQQIEHIKGQQFQCLNEAVLETEAVKKENAARQQLMEIEIESLREQNAIFVNKAQQLEHERISWMHEKERKNTELHLMHQEIQKMTTVIGNLKQKQMQAQLQQQLQQLQNQPPVPSFTPESSFYGRSGSAGKVYQPPQLNTPQTMNQQKVFTQQNLNVDWSSMSHHQQQPYRDLTPNPFDSRHQNSSPSPMKGKLDPNMAQYARRQNLNPVNVQQDFETQLQEMNIQEMQQMKSKMENEYARIPITITGKSLQIKKRKEELEYELDLVEKYISRAKLQHRAQ